MSEIIRVLIVDDEAPAREILEEMLGERDDVEVVGQSPDGFQAVRAVADLSPDLVFLDIQMPKLDGFEVLQLIEGDVSVVFVTAYDQYALKAFEVNAVDYLLKPFSETRLGEALDRARAGVSQALASLCLIAAQQLQARGLTRAPGIDSAAPAESHGSSGGNR